MAIDTSQIHARKTSHQQCAPLAALDGAPGVLTDRDWWRSWRGVLQCPPDDWIFITHSNNRARKLDANIIPQGGTAQQRRSRPASPASGRCDNFKVLVLFTDGEVLTTRENAVEAAQAAAAKA